MTIQEVTFLEKDHTYDYLHKCIFVRIHTYLLKIDKLLNISLFTFSNIIFQDCLITTDFSVHQNLPADITSMLLPDGKSGIVPINLLSSKQWQKMSLIPNQKIN